MHLVAPPMMFDEQTTLPRGPVPEIGQHIEEILLELGFEWEEIERLRESGVTGFS